MTTDEVPRSGTVLLTHLAELPTRATLTSQTTITIAMRKTFG